MSDIIYHKFELQWGYVESCRLTTLTMYHKDGFSSVPDALFSLREALEDYLKAGVKFKDCCKNYFEQKEFNYCPKCGKRLEEYKVDPYELGNLLSSFWTHDVNSFASDGLDDALGKYGWSVWNQIGLPEDAPVCFIESVENWMHGDVNGETDGWVSGPGWDSYN